jgi:hypothetical protein
VEQNCHTCRIFAGPNPEVYVDIDQARVLQRCLKSCTFGKDVSFYLLQ